MHVVPQSRTSLQSPTFESTMNAVLYVCMHIQGGWSMMLFYGIMRNIVIWNYVFVVMYITEMPLGFQIRVG